MAAFHLLTTKAADLDLGLSLCGQHPTLGAFDAVLAAVALNNDAGAIVSGDQAFATVPRLRWIDPATPALDQLLRRGH